MKRVLGLQDHAIKDCTRAVQLNPEYLKAILRRAEIYEETDKLGRCGLLILGLRAFFLLTVVTIQYYKNLYTHTHIHIHIHKQGKGFLNNM
jgi:ABC-type transporter Mla maintaining outer membrane lipid asymmetry permease subunit MlaE